MLCEEASKERTDRGHRGHSSFTKAQKGESGKGKPEIVFAERKDAVDRAGTPVLGPILSHQPALQLI